MLNYFFLLFLMLNGLVLSTRAQEVFATGGSVSNELTYTIGEPLTLTLIGDNVLTQGFNQPVITVLKVEELGGSKMEVFPNPSSTEINILIEETQSFSVDFMNESGELILFQEVKNNQRVNVEELAAGGYWILIKDSNHQLIGRIKFTKN